MIEFVPDTIVELKWWDWRTEDDRPPGYYFWDELASKSFGPFEDSVQASDALDGYLNDLDEPTREQYLKKWPK